MPQLKEELYRIIAEHVRYPTEAEFSLAYRPPPWPADPSTPAPPTPPHLRQDLGRNKRVWRRLKDARKSGVALSS